MITLDLDKEYLFKTIQSSDSASITIIGYALRNVLQDKEIVRGYG